MLTLQRKTNHIQVLWYQTKTSWARVPTCRSCLPINEEDGNVATNNWSPECCQHAIEPLQKWNCSNCCLIAPEALIWVGTSFLPACTDLSTSIFFWLLSSCPHMFGFVSIILFHSASLYESEYVYIWYYMNVRIGLHTWMCIYYMTYVYTVYIYIYAGLDLILKESSCHGPGIRWPTIWPWEAVPRDLHGSKLCISSTRPTKFFHCLASNPSTMTCWYELIYIHLSFLVIMHVVFGSCIFSEFQNDGGPLSLQLLFTVSYPSWFRLLNQMLWHMVLSLHLVGGSNHWCS